MRYRDFESWDCGQNGPHQWLWNESEYGWYIKLHLPIMETETTCKQKKKGLIWHASMNNDKSLSKETYKHRIYLTIRLQISLLIVLSLARKPNDRSSINLQDITVPKKQMYSLILSNWIVCKSLIRNVFIKKSNDLAIECRYSDKKELNKRRKTFVFN